MDYSTLQSRLLARLNMSSDDPAAASVDELINEAIHLIETANPSGWSWLHASTNITVTASDFDYAFSAIDTLVSKIIDVKVLDGSQYAPLTLVSPEEADRAWQSTSNAFPNVWWAEGQTLYLRPTPNATYTVKLRYIKGEPDLSATTSQPIIPARFHTAIVVAGLVLYYETLQDANRAQMAQQQLDRWINRMMAAQSETEWAPRVRSRDFLYG